MIGNAAHKDGCKDVVSKDCTALEQANKSIDEVLNSMNKTVDTFEKSENKRTYARNANSGI